MRPVIVVGLLLLLPGAVPTARAQPIPIGQLPVEPGPLVMALKVPTGSMNQAFDDLGRSSLSSYLTVQEVLEEPPLWPSVIYGLGAKILINGLLVDMAGDTFHALPSLPN